MKNVVAYCRVSTDGQVGEDKFGIDAQKEQIMEFCAKNDMQISGWYVDEGVSGAKEDRPEFDKLIYGNDTQNPPVEAVVVAKSDRVARDINIYFYYKHELLKKGMDLISVAEDFGQMGVLSAALEALVLCMAQMERDNITKRTSGGRAVKAARGGYSGGRPPYGYRTVGGNLEIVESEAKAVKLIFHLKKDGATYQQMCDALNEAGMVNKSGGKFSISTIQVILKNENLYKGMYKYGKTDKWVKGVHEPILKGE
jgi:site-specific DNA recombinase